MCYLQCAGQHQAASQATPTCVSEAHSLPDVKHAMCQIKCLYLLKLYLDPLTDTVDVYAERTEESKFRCRLCPYLARDKYNMRSHLDGKHMLSSGYPCDICNSSVQKTKQALNQHKHKCAQLAALAQFKDAGLWESLSGRNWGLRGDILYRRRVCVWCKKTTSSFSSFFVKNPFHCDTYLNLVHLSRRCVDTCC